MFEKIAVSAIIPTRNRPEVLTCTLESLLKQETIPQELIIVDASVGVLSRGVVESFAEKSGMKRELHWVSAQECGAAAQRNQGVRLATQPWVLFLDDDIIFQPQAIARLWAAAASHGQIGGVSSMITNQCYGTPGRITRTMYRLMGSTPPYAGRMIGPALNILPQDEEWLPEVVPVEWLNTTCTLYRREALPDPPFPPNFVGYSLMEDVALSLEVGKRWKLVNARTARIFHDSQPGSHKADPNAVAYMQIKNRYWVMTEVMQQRGLGSVFRLFLWEFFMVIAAVVSSKKKALPWRGKVRALGNILHTRWKGKK